MMTVTARDRPARSGARASHQGGCMFLTHDLRHGRDEHVVDEPLVIVAVHRGHNLCLGRAVVHDVVPFGRRLRNDTTTLLSAGGAMTSANVSNVGRPSSSAWAALRSL